MQNELDHLEPIQDVIDCLSPNDPFLPPSSRHL